MTNLEQFAADHIRTFSPDACPEEIRDALQRYVEHGIPTGDCLRAILANDLMQAFARADVYTARAMPSIASYIHNRIPSEAHGSYEAVDQWIRHAKIHRAVDNLQQSFREGE